MTVWFRLPRINFRIKKFGYTLFLMVAKTQTVEGITSLRPNGKHLVFFDLENYEFEQYIKTPLRHVQKKHNLSNIYLVSDAENSYRGWCFNEVNFRTLLRIINDEELEPYLDYNFLWWTVHNGKATLRTSSKLNRPKQKLVSILESYFIEPPTESLEKVTYDTGDDKKMVNFLLGDKP